MKKGTTESPRYATELERLIALGPDEQGDVDESLLRDNLRLSPVQRLEAASTAANGVETLRAALQRALHA